MNGGKTGCRPCGVYSPVLYLCLSCHSEWLCDSCAQPQKDWWSYPTLPRCPASWHYHKRMGSHDKPIADRENCFNGSFFRGIVPCPECFLALDSSSMRPNCCGLHFKMTLHPGDDWEPGSAFKEGDDVFLDLHHCIVRNEWKSEGPFGARTRVYLRKVSSGKNTSAPRIRLRCAINQITAKEPAKLRIERSHALPPDELAPRAHRAKAIQCID
jgi:hypothetical protein